MRDITSGHILTNWQPSHEHDFGRKSLRLSHSLHTSSLFTDEALETLLSDIPREHYHVTMMDDREGNPSIKREGELKGLTGRQVLDAVKKGKIWINLQDPDRLDPRYGDLLGDIYDEFKARVPGFNSFKHKMTILISSPKLKVKYHMDLPGQTLWQMRGSKRVYVYPASEPFLRQKDLDGVTLGEMHETDITFHPAFDRYAEVYDLQPGEMLHWPLNCPHRIENHDCVNVSLTTEHWTKPLRARYATNYGNAVLRKFGRENLSTRTTGVSYLAKLGLTAGFKLSGMQQRKAKPFEIDFAVDPQAENAVRDITPFEYRK